MAKISSIYRSQVGGINIANSIRPEQQSNGLLDSASQFTSTLNQRQQIVSEEQRLIAERKATQEALQLSNDFTLQLETAKQEALANSLTGQEYNDTINQVIHDFNSNIPDTYSIDGKNKFVQDSQRYINRERIEALERSSQIDAKNSAMAIGDRINIEANRTLTNPDNFTDSKNEIYNVIDNSDLTQQQKAEFKRDTKNNLSISYFNGKLNQENFDEILTELNSGTWDARLTPQQKQQFIQKAERGIEAIQQKNNWVVKDTVKNYVESLSDGGTQRINISDAELKAAFGDQWKRQRQRIHDWEAFSTEFNKISNATPEFIEELRTKLQPNDIANYSQDKKQIEIFERAVAKRQQFLDDDPVAYTITHNDTVAYHYERGDYDMVIAEQERLGVATPRLLTNKQAQVMISQYETANEDAMNFVGQVVNNFGQHSQVAMADLLRSGLDSNFASIWALGAESPASLYLSRMTQGDNYKNALANNQISQQDLDIESINVLEDFDLTTTSPSTKAQIRRSVNHLAMGYLSSGIVDNIGDGVDKAYEELITNNYEIQDSVRIPKSQYTSQTLGNLQSFIDNMPNNQALFNAIIDVSDPVLNNNMAKNAYLSTQDFVAMTSNDDRGVYILDKLMQPVELLNGNPLFFTWEEINANDFGYDSIDEVESNNEVEFIGGNW